MPSQPTGTRAPASEAEARFLEALPTIRRIIGAAANRHALSASDRDDFETWATGRLMANDYAILAKFGGRSSLATFLTVVIGNLLRDYRNANWGRWRPSAAASRMGPMGVRLEELTVRDRCSVREAIAMLHSAGAAQPASELMRMAAQLARRVPEAEVSLDEASAQPARERVDDLAHREERQRLAQALRNAVNELPDEDRLITRMRFWDGVSIADIARILHMDQKPLYRRVEGIQRRLQGILARYKVSEHDVQGLLAGDDTW